MFVVSLRGFKETRSLLNRSFVIRTDDETLVLAKAVGEVHLNFDKFRLIVLKDYFYVSNFKRNLFLNWMWNEEQASKRSLLHIVLVPKGAYQSGQTERSCNLTGAVTTACFSTAIALVLLLSQRLIQPEHEGNIISTFYKIKKCPLTLLS